MEGGFGTLYAGPVNEAPYDLVLAVNSGLQVLSWFENLPRDEQPPRHIWWSDKLLDEWFENVREQRDAKTGGGGRTRSSWDEGTEVPLSQNELAQQYRKAARG